MKEQIENPNHIINITKRIHEKFVKEHRSQGKTPESQQEEAKCICVHFSDTAGYRISDLACPIHGINSPGGLDDGYWED